MQIFYCFFVYFKGMSIYLSEKIKKETSWTSLNFGLDANFCLAMPHVGHQDVQTIYHCLGKPQLILLIPILFEQ